MKLMGLIGVALILLSEIPFSRNEEYIPAKLTPRPFLRLDYDLMIPGQVVVGKDVFLKCIYPPANDTLWVNEYIFFFNRTRLSNDPRNGITIFGDSLVLEKVKKTHAGKYFCRVRNSIGEDKPGYDYDLVVFDSTNPDNPDYEGLPVIHLELGDNTTNHTVISRFDNVSLICSAEPNSTVINRIVFLRDGEEIKRHDVGRKTFSNVTLDLPRIEMNLTGKYYCEAFTIFGDIFSNVLPIYVTNAVYHSSKATRYLNLTVNLGNEIDADEIQEYDTVYMTCDIVPSTADNLNPTWFQNGKNLPENVENGIIFEGMMLILNHTKKSSTGRYSCMVDTDQGILMSNNSVRIQVKDNVTAISIVSEKFRKLDIERLCPAVWKLLHLPHIPRAKLQLREILSMYDYLIETDNVQLTCSVTPITAKVRKIIWFLDGNKLVPNETVEIINHPPTLVFPCIKKQYNGTRVTCRAEIDGGGKTPNSNAFKIELMEARRDLRDKCRDDNPILVAELLHHPDFIYINQSEVWLHCHVYAKNMEFGFHGVWWYRDNQDLRPLQVDNSTLPAKLPDDYVTQHGRSLKIHRIKESYIGNYQCEIYTDRNIFRSSFAPILEVKDRNKIPAWKITTPPIVIAELQDDPNNKYENDFVFFYCSIKPKTVVVLSTRWFFNDELLDEMVHKNVTFSGRSLILNSVKKAHAGNYLCQIETSEGTFTSDPTRLKIQNGTKIYRTPWDTGEVFPLAKLGNQGEMKNIYVNDNIYLYCDIIPLKTIVFEFVWYRNETQIIPNGKDIIQQNDRILNLNNIPKNATGNYHCQAYTKKGLWKSTGIYLNVEPGKRNSKKETIDLNWIRFNRFHYGL